MMMPLTQVTNGEVLSVKFKVYAITYPMMHAWTKNIKAAGAGQWHS